LNAALNLAAGLLTRDIRAAALSAGLHPGMGIVHGATGEGLVWDLVEPFRALLAEGLVVALMNRNRLPPGLFVERPAGVRLDREGARVVIEGYEAALAVVARSSHTGQRHTMRRRLIEEARALARHLRDPGQAPWAPDVQDF
jgi:CRISPR-associated protein Cas1